MKYFLKIIAYSLILLTPITAYSQKFVEGTHYSRIEPSSARADTNTDKGGSRVVEYFSFSCPGCYAIEPAIEGLIKSDPNLRLQRVHMPFGGPKAKFSQKAFVLLTLLKAEKHKNRIFERIHVDRNTFDSDEEIVGFFESLGYERTKVSSSLNSFTADTMLRTMNTQAVKNKISSVPTIIVNNKFKVNIREVDFRVGLLKLIQHLNSLP